MKFSKLLSAVIAFSLILSWSLSAQAVEKKANTAGNENIVESLKKHGLSDKQKAEIAKIIGRYKKESAMARGNLSKARENQKKMMMNSDRFDEKRYEAPGRRFRD